MKTAAKVLAGVLVVAMIWGGIFLSWHVRIVRALRDLEKGCDPTRIQPRPEASEAESVLVNAGCRSLPLLIGSLDGSKSPDYLYRCSELVCWQSVHPGELPASSDSEVLATRTSEWCITTKDDAASRRRKCDLMKTWWRNSGADHHQWWRVWSSRCTP